MTTRFINMVTIVLVAVILYAFFTAVDVFAQGNDLRANACRTFHIFAHEVEQTGETDGLYCGTVENTKEDKPVNPPTTTIVTVPDEPETPIIIELPIIEDDDTPPNDEIIPEPEVTPEPEDPGKQKCNAGRGNGSEGNPDCDPGNSGGHNNGGD